MKQSKRFLSVLLSIVMVLSLFTVSASAYRTDYTNPAGYDSVLDPYFSNAQGITALLDMIDDLLAEKVDLHKSIVGIDLDIYSLDSLCDSVNSLFDSTAYKIAKILNLGDIEDMNWSAIENSSNRRRNPGMSDSEFFARFCTFLTVNHNYLKDWADNTFDLGVIASWGIWDPRDELPMLNDLHGYLNETVYKLLIDEEGNGYATGGNYDNLDNILQKFLNDYCVKMIVDAFADEDDGSNKVAEFLNLRTDAEGKLAENMGLLGLLPSLSASDISITSISTYDLFINLFNALIDDIVLPYAGKLILDLLEIPEDDVTADTNYIDVAINLFVDAETLGYTEEDGIDVVTEFLRSKGVENPEAPKPIDKVNTTLEYIIKVGIKKYIHFVGTRGVNNQLQLTEYFNGMIADLVKMVIPMLPTFSSDFEALTREQEEALETMTDQEVFAFGLKVVLDALIDGVHFPDDCHTIKELATWTLVNVAAELEPSVDFEYMIDTGAINPDSLQCLDIAATVIRYYLVGETTLEYPNLTPSFNELLNQCFEQYLGAYTPLFNLYPTTADRTTYQGNVWYKVYNTVCQWIPLTNILYGCEDSWSGLEDLLMNDVVGSVLNFDLNGLVGIIGRRSDSDLCKPFSKLVANLLARILNGVFKLPSEKTAADTNAVQKDQLIVPYSYTRLDQITTNSNSTTASFSGCGLKNTVDNLLEFLGNVTGTGNLLDTSAATIVTLVGILDLDEFEYMDVQYRNNASGESYSINDLRTLYNQLKVPENENVKYYENGYQFFHMVDYAPWAYLDNKSAINRAGSIIEQYDNAKSAAQEPTRAEITCAYYALYHTYYDLLVANERAANNYQLNKVYTKATEAAYTNGGGSQGQIYTNRSWDAYQKAYAFATQVMNEYATAQENGTLNRYRQSKVNTARRELIDAIDGLKLNCGDADYTELLNAISRLNDLMSPSMFTSKTVQNVIDAYNTALAFSREIKYDSDNQIVVDGVTERLVKAYDNLTRLPRIDQFDPDNPMFITDDTKSYVYGVAEDFYTAEEQELCENDFSVYFQFFWDAAPDGADGFDYAPTANGNGTGTRIRLVSDNDGDGVCETVNRTYTLILFGDLNGDSFVDGQDAVLQKAYANRMLKTTAATEYMLRAGDIDLDGYITNTDARSVENAGVKKAEINQFVTQYAELEQSFADLVNQ